MTMASAIILLMPLFLLNKYILTGYDPEKYAIFSEKLKT